MMQRFLVLIFVFLATFSQTIAQDHHGKDLKGHADKVVDHHKAHAADAAHSQTHEISGKIESNVKTSNHTTVSESAHAGHNHEGHAHNDAHAGHGHSDVKGHVGHENHGDSHDAHVDGGHGDAHGAHGHDEKFDVASTAIHHIGDANVWSILDAVRIPLPMILKSQDGWDFFMSNKFEIGHHEDGHKSHNGYVMHHGSVHRVTDASFPRDKAVTIDSYSHEDYEVEGKTKTKYFAHAGGKKYSIDRRTTLDGGALGGGITSFWDFSITKNVIAIVLVMGLLFFLFAKAAKRYKTNPDKAPKGLQGLLEPLILFIRDEVAVPFIGEKKYKKFLPFLLSVFFFILGLNLFGQIPFLGNVNATGNLTITLVLAVITFFVVNLSGNRDYWGHIFWNPDAPGPIKLLLAPVELMGIFIKPITLMLRLAGNISAGHIAIVAFLGLIFILGENGKNLGGTVAGTALGVGLTIFMSALELLVAFVQAFVFTLLSASYIGMAVEEHHHDDHH